MSKYAVGEEVYFTPAAVFAEVVVVLAVRPRRWLGSMYLVKRHGDRDPEWTHESRLDRISVEVTEVKS